MYRFINGFLSVLLVIWLLACWFNIITQEFQLAAMVDTIDNMIELGMVLCVIPIIGAGGTAYMVHRLFPRRIFDGLRHSWSPYFYGMFTSVITITATAFLLVWKPMLPESFSLLIVSMVTTLFMVVIFCTRRRVGFCLHCEYDITASLSFGRCPECGQSLTA